MQGTSFHVELEERGVYWRSALSADGFPVAYAVDSRGREIAAHEVKHHKLAEVTLAGLWTLLDERDPSFAPRKPLLTLVKPTDRVAR